MTDPMRPDTPLDHAEPAHPDDASAVPPPSGTRLPPAPEWVAAEADLLAQGEALSDALSQGIADWHAEAEATVLGPLREQIERAGRLHERIHRTTLGRLPDLESERAPEPVPEPSPPETETESPSEGDASGLAYPPDPETVALDDEEAADRARAELEEAATAAEKAAEQARRAEAAERAQAETEALRALWKQATAYRTGIHERVIVPLRDHLAGAPLSQRLVAPLRASLDALTGRAEAAEATVTLPLAPSLLAPSTEDTPLRTFGKQARRARHAVQHTRRGALNTLLKLVGKPPRPLPALHRSVPAQTLLRRHAADRLLRLAVAPHAAAQQHLADAVGALELALAAWTTDVLRAEETLDRSGLHRPEILLRDDLMPSEAMRGKADAAKADAALAGSAKEGRDQADSRALRVRYEGIAEAFAKALAAIPLTPLGESLEVAEPERSASEPAGSDRAEPVLVDAVDEERAGEERAEAVAEDPTAAKPTLPLASLEAGALAVARDAWRRDVERGGTFLLKTPRRKRSDRDYTADLTDKADAWARWHGEALNRVQLYDHLARLRAELLAVEDDLLAELARAVIAPINDAFRPLMGELGALQKQAAEACDAAEASLAEAPAPGGESSDSDEPTAAQREAETLADRIEQLQKRGITFLDRALRDLPGLVTATQALTEPGRTAFAQARTLLDTLPESLALHALPEASAAHSADRHARRYAVRLRDQADRAINPPYPERLRSSADALRQRVSHVWGETEQVRHIVQYNLGAAIAELRDPSASEPTELSPADVLAPSGESHDAQVEAAAPDAETAAYVDPYHDALSGARELAADGLRRASETLPELAHSLGAPWNDLQRATFRAVEEDWVALHRAARSDAFIEGQWVNLRTRLSRDAKQGQRDLARAWAAFRERAAKWLRIGQRRAKRLIEKGQSAVGVVEATEEDRLTTLDAITGVPALLEALPLVYRRLFAFDPLAEPSLLEGRTRDLARIRLHLKRWKGGQEAGALLIAMPLGSGRTSLLNVAESNLSEEAQVCRVRLEHRVRSEHTLVRALAKALGLADLGVAAGATDSEPVADLDRPLTFADLEHALENRPREQSHRAILVDDIEHLVLRARGGSVLVERFLIFISRTDTLIFWVLAAGEDAWSFLERTARAAAGLVTVHRPAPVDRATLEAIIVGRHRRSGLPLTFEAPSDLPPLTRQRLRRADTPEETQSVLREDYFDRLHRAAGQNIMLALLHWLRSADFKSEAGALHVQPLEPLSFLFLSAFDRDRAFTLKAFLDHKTLTLEDHDRIFRMSRAQSTFLLEALINQRLIVPHGAPRGVAALGRIEPGIAYRLRPLILHPLAQYLRGQHIVY